MLFLISDLFEGGNGDADAPAGRRVRRSGVTVVVLLALSDEGTPAHDHENAAALAALGATVMSTTPDRFPDVARPALAGT